MNATPLPTTGNPTTAHVINNQRVLFIARALVWGITLLCLTTAILIIPILFDNFNHPSPEQAEAIAQIGSTAIVLAIFKIVLIVVINLAFFGVAGIILMRRSTDRMGLFTVVFLITFGVGAGISYEVDFAILIKTMGFFFQAITLLAYLAFFTFFLVFPDGRFVPRWSWLLYIPGCIIIIPWNVLPPTSPLSPLSWSPLLFIPIFIIVWGGCFGVQVYRYRRVSSPAQRQQTKYFLYGAFLTLVANVTFWSVNSILFTSQMDAVLRLWLEIFQRLAALSLMAIPVSLGFAIFRFRLWDIDLIINRSLVYGAITLVIVFIFFVATLLLQIIIGKQQPIVAAIIAVIVSGLSYNTLKGKAQHIIDRRIYGLRFDLNQLNAAQALPQVQNPGALTGRKLGVYNVLDVLGKGGMGEVYKAQGDSKTVALKILPDELARQEEFRTRFQREAQTLQSLDHPNIVKLFSSGDADGTIYIAMEYIQGQELKDAIVEQTALSPQEARRILNHLADALDYAHEKGLVHRDIKPSNIMLRVGPDQETHQAVLMDFGIAKIKDARTRYTGSGAIGTIDYMAPEQIMTAKEVDKRADIYALGIVAYEMLTGKRPFEGNAAQVMFAHIQQPAPDPRETHADIPRSMAKAIMKALDKDPNERFQSAGEFVAAFNP